MKYLKLFFFSALTFLLVGCEELGIEVTTVKGYWESKKYEDGGYYTMRLDDNDKFCFYLMVTDSTCAEKYEGTWLCKDDTISLYTQKSSADLLIKTLSQNTMTLQTRKKNYIIMSRVPNADFYEVLELKGGFWWFVSKTFFLLLGLISLTYAWLFFKWLGRILWELKKWLGRLIKQIKVYTETKGSKK